MNKRQVRRLMSTSSSLAVVAALALAGQPVLAADTTIGPNVSLAATVVNNSPLETLTITGVNTTLANGLINNSTIGTTNPNSPPASLFITNGASVNGVTNNGEINADQSGDHAVFISGSTIGTLFNNIGIMDADGSGGDGLHAEGSTMNGIRNVHDVDNTALLPASLSGRIEGASDGVYFGTTGSNNAVMSTFGLVNEADINGGSTGVTIQDGGAGFVTWNGGIQNKLSSIPDFNATIFGGEIGIYVDRVRDFNGGIHNTGQSSASFVATISSNGTAIEIFDADFGGGIHQDFAEINGVDYGIRVLGNGSNIPVSVFRGGIHNTFGSINGSNYHGIDIRDTDFNDGIFNSSGSITGGETGIHIGGGVAAVSTISYTGGTEFNGGISNVSGTIDGGYAGIEIEGGYASMSEAGAQAIGDTVFNGGISNDASSSINGSFYGIYVNDASFNDGIDNYGQISSQTYDSSTAIGIYGSSGYAGIAGNDFNGGITNQSSASIIGNNFAIDVQGTLNFNGGIENYGLIQQNGIFNNAFTASLGEPAAINIDIDGDFNGGFYNDDEIIGQNGVQIGANNINGGFHNDEYGEITGSTGTGVFLAFDNFDGAIVNDGVIEGSFAGVVISGGSPGIVNYSGSGNGTVQGGIDNSGVMAGGSIGLQIGAQIGIFQGNIASVGALSEYSSSVSVLNTGLICGGCDIFQSKATSNLEVSGYDVYGTGVLISSLGGEYAHLTGALLNDGGIIVGGSEDKFYLAAPGPGAAIDASSATGATITVNQSGGLIVGDIKFAESYSDTFIGEEGYGTLSGYASSGGGGYLAAVSDVGANFLEEDELSGLFVGHLIGYGGDCSGNCDLNDSVYIQNGLHAFVDGFDSSASVGSLAIALDNPAGYNLSTLNVDGGTLLLGAAFRAQGDNQSFTPDGTDFDVFASGFDIENLDYLSVGSSYSSGGTLYVDDDTYVQVNNQYYQYENGTLEYFLTTNTDKHGVIDASTSSGSVYLSGTLAALLDLPRFATDGIEAGDEYAYDALISAGDRNGSFDDVIDNSIFFTTEIANARTGDPGYDDNTDDPAIGDSFDQGSSTTIDEVDVVVTFDGIENVLDPDLTDNQRSTAAAIDEILAENSFDPGFEQLLVSLFLADDEDEARDTLDTLHGSEYAQVSQIALDQTAHFDGLLRGRLNDAKESLGGANYAGLRPQLYADAGAAIATDAGATAPGFQGNHGLTRKGSGWSGWGGVYGTWSENDGDENSPAYKADSGGFIFGADFASDARTLVGVTAQYLKAEVDFTTPGSDADIDGWRVGIYASHGMGSWYLDGQASYGWFNNDVERMVAFNGLEKWFEPFSEHTGDEYNSQVFSIAGEVGTILDRDNWRFQPYFGLAYRNASFDDISEAPCLFCLWVQPDDAESLASSLGLRATVPTTVDGMPVVPEFTVAWQHEFLDDRQDFNATFQGAPDTTFNVVGSEVDPDRLLVGLGLNAAVTDEVNVLFGYNGTFSQDQDAHAVEGKVRVNW